ncbi:MAG: ROK family protein [Spirochaetales bacterium]|nr:ROK family protein [Spirochaetales bacterium]
MKLAGNRRGRDLVIKNQQLIKETNLKNVFSLIYSSSGISRVNLVELTGLSPTTVSALVEELLEYELICTMGVGESKTSGRKPIMLEVNRDCAQIATIAWQKSGFSFSLLDLGCSEIEEFSVIVPSGAAFEDVIEEIITNRSQLIDTEKILAICLSIPAIIDSTNKKVITSVLDIDENDDILSRINNKFPELPVMIGNESAFYAYAEHEFSSLQDTRNLIYININVGVGAGIIQNGEIYRGAHGMAGEFGHISMDVNGPECSCGNRGCLERLIKTPRIIELVIDGIKNGKHSEVEALCIGDFSMIDIPMIAVAYNNGDELVTEILSDVARILSFALNNIISFYDPKTIVLGGGIERLGPAFLGEVRTQTKIAGFRKIVSSVDIIFTELSSFNYRNKGAAKYYLDNIFRISGNKKDELIIC